jgi:uncharacterized membrane protein
MVDIYETLISEIKNVERQISALKAKREHLEATAQYYKPAKAAEQLALIPEEVKEGATHKDRVLLLLKDVGPATVKELQEKLGINAAPTVYRVIRNLSEAGKIKKGSDDKWGIIK